MKFFLTLASVSTIALLCSLVSAQHQIKDEYPLCQTSDAAIGEVPDRPFSATVEEGLRRIQQDGNSVRADSTPDSQAGLVVRDRSGRVMIASKSTSTQSAEGNTREWSEVLCDPLKGTVTNLKLRAAERSSGSDTDIPPRPDAYISTGAEGTALVEVQKGHTTVVFWNVTRKVPNLVRGLKRAGFTGGWLNGA
jgi:hypothetical protein